MPTLDISLEVGLGSLVMGEPSLLVIVCRQKMELTTKFHSREVEEQPSPELVTAEQFFVTCAVNI
jgi:hypothetical protein